MARYHIHFVDHSGNVFDAIVTEHDSDEKVIEHAHRLDIPSVGAGFDVWHNKRLVHRYRR